MAKNWTEYLTEEERAMNKWWQERILTLTEEEMTR